MSSKNKKYKQILFKLTKAAEGYPPNDWETLWAYEVNKEFYSIDNIPFFVRGVAWKDVISVKLIDGELHFDKVIQSSGHSVLRLFIFEESKVGEVHEMLQQQGCDTEQSHIPKLISVDVPATVSLIEIVEILKQGESEGRWEYEEASLAQ